MVNKLKLNEEFKTYQINFKSKSFKTYLFKKYGTKLRMPQFRGWEIITLKCVAIVDTALRHDSEQVLSHYAVRQDSSPLKDFTLSCSHSVYLIITTDRHDKVIQSSLNGAKVHGALDIPRHTLLRLSLLCKPCVKRLTPACI